MPAYRLNVCVYKNGTRCYDFDPNKVSQEIKKLFYYHDDRFVINHENPHNGRVDGLSINYLDDDEDEMPIPSEWLEKTEKGLRLVGDRLPLTIDGDPNMEIRFVVGSKTDPFRSNE